LLFAVVVAGLGLRLSQLIVDPHDPIGSDAVGRVGSADFRDVIYYPSHAIREGVNPYDCRLEPLADGSPRFRLRYPILNALPLYSPLIFVLFAPFSFGPFEYAAIAWVAFNMLLQLLFAYLCWRVAGTRPTICQVTMFAAVMLATQSGRANFIGGDTAIPLAIGSLAAVYFARQNPWLAGWALALTSFKPTFGLPLGILLFAAGYYRTVLSGWTIGFVAAVTGLVIIFANSGDLAEMPSILKHNQEVLESDPDGNALLSPIRVDAASALQRWLPVSGGMVSIFASCLVLGIACWSLFRLRKCDSPEARAVEVAIVSIATIACMFHITYDAMLVWGAVASIGLTSRRIWQNTSWPWRMIVTAMVLVPMVNVLGTKTWQRYQTEWLSTLNASPMLQDAGWSFVCTLNGLALLAALVLLGWKANELARKTA
jgi:hypothetical protein